MNLDHSIPDYLNFKLDTFNENKNVSKTKAFHARSYSSRKLVLGCKIDI